MTQNSVLYNHSVHTACKDIFNAFCQAISEHYQSKGLKYTKSKRSIIKETDSVRTQIAFHSMRFNTPGEYVAVEMVVSIYVKLDGEFPKMPTFGNTGMFSRKLESETKGLIKVEKIFGELIERIEDWRESEYLISNNFNAYGFTPQKLQRIIEFIDLNVLDWTDKIFDAEHIREYIENAGPRRKGMMSRSSFIPFVKEYFPEQGFEKLLLTN